MQRLTPKKIPWIHTDQGKHAVTFGYAGFIGAAMFASFLPHTYFIDRYKNFLHHYSLGAPTPVSDKVSKLFDECLKLLNIEEKCKQTYQPFTITGFDVYSIGTSYSRQGVNVGIPTSFDYDSVHEVNRSNIMVKDKDIDWNSEIGDKLASSLVLPEKAQKYLICREIKSAQNFKLHLNLLNLSWSGLVVYMFSAGANKKFGLLERPKNIRFTFYNLAALFGMGLYFMTKDTLQLYYDRKVDNELAEMGKEFVEGGLIFYEKTIERNKALREILGKKGEKQYSRLGNENYLLRMKKLPITDRKEFFLKKLNEIENA